MKQQGTKIRICAAYGLAFMIIGLYFLLIHYHFPFIYDINDDVAMRNVAAGVITGEPDAHLIHIKYILGLDIKYGYLSINPHVPQNWKEYEIKYRYKNSIYNIKVIKTNNNPITDYNKNMKFFCNGIEIEDKKIKLEENGIYNIEIIL